MVKKAHKKSFILLELIVSILLFSILTLGTVEFIFAIRNTTAQSSDLLEDSLKLESTRLFLFRNKQLTLLTYNNGSLYFNGDLLLDNVSKYNIQIASTIATIDICINNNTVCQTWKIRV